MYLSKVIIRNFRSIKELDVDFQPGKNVIVGKNNGGKSNIVRAIDLVLGENSPAYDKFENITDLDFFTVKEKKSKDQIQLKTADEIQIICFLQRLAGEELDFNEINKCPGFYKYIESKIYRPTFQLKEHRFQIDKFSATEIDTLFSYDINIDDPSQPGYVEKKDKCQWVDGKLNSQRKFKDELNDKHQFVLVFKAKRTQNGRPEKEIRFFYREDDTQNWNMGFSAPIRNELLQSAIIQSFRDPQNSLRINQWSWMGKMLRKSINTEDIELQTAFNSLKTASDKIFAQVKEDINDSRIKVAFPETEISLQFNPDSKIDIYKSALIYVDDGFNSQLQDKGSGIQSAVTIGLFNYYIRKFAHVCGSLLIIEEPEIYLHPQARRVISARIDDFLDNNNSQAIITTHSPEFISSAHEKLNIILTRKEAGKGSIATNALFSGPKERAVLVKRQNAEMFFADKVLLVEGGEKYIIEALAKDYGLTKKPHLGEGWLDDKNCSIIETGGKPEFWKYFNKLQELGIETYILADFDFFLRGLGDFMTNTHWDIDKKSEYNTINGKLGQINDELPEEIAISIKELSTFIATQGFRIDAADLRKNVRSQVRLKRLDQIPHQNIEEVKAFMRYLTKQKIFILTGELEDFFTTDAVNSFAGKRLGKKEKPLYIVSDLIEKPEDIHKYINCDEYKKFLDVVTKEWKAVPTSVASVLSPQLKDNQSDALHLDQ